MYSRGPTSTRESKKLNDNQIFYQPNNKMSPYSTSSNKNQIQYQPALYWKNISNGMQIKKDNTDRLLSQGNQNNLQYLNNHQNNNGYLPFQNREIIQTSITNKLDQQKRKKQQMKKKFQEIQKKILPILNGQKNIDEEEDADFGWYNRMEQRIMKLQTNIDLIQKQTQIKIQKRLLEAEKQWNSRIQALLLSSSPVPGKKQNNASKLSHITHNHIKNQQPYPEHPKHSHQQNNNEYKQQIKKNIKQDQYLQDEKVDEGYYTEKQNQKEKLERQRQQLIAKKNYGRKSDNQQTKKNRDKNK